MTSERVFVPGYIPPETRSERAWWFAFRGYDLLIALNEDSASIPCVVDFTEIGLSPIRENYIGQLGGRHCFAVELPEGTDPPAGMVFEGLRQVWGRVDEDLFWLAGRAEQIIEWDRTHQFCTRCGTRVRPRADERAKECPDCGYLQYPRLSPAIIVLVERGDALLLARAWHFPPGRYSVLAGFVEPGETLEETVVREIREEVGIEVKDIRYFASQSWPFPHSLMLGFTASYASGEISIDDREIEDAGWYTADNLPEISGKISISRRLIDWFLAKHGRSVD